MSFSGFMPLSFLKVPRLPRTCYSGRGNNGNSILRKLFNSLLLPMGKVIICVRPFPAPQFPFANPHFHASIIRQCEGILHLPSPLPIIHLLGNPFPEHILDVPTTSFESANLFLTKHRDERKFLRTYHSLIPFTLASSIPLFILWIYSSLITPSSVPLTST